MANLKIRVGAVDEIPLTIQSYNYYITTTTEFSNSTDATPTYNDAKNYFSPPLSSVGTMKEVLIVFNKNETELFALSSSGGRFIFNLKGTYKNTIKKIRFRIESNVYSFPNGAIDVPFGGVDENLYVVGEGGILFIDGVPKTPSTTEVNYDYVLPTLSSDFTLPVTFRNYQAIRMPDYDKYSQSYASIFIELLDASNNVISIDEGSSFTQVLMQKYSNIAERKKTVTVSNSVVIKNSYSNNVPLAKDIIIQKLPVNGYLELNGNPVTQYLSITTAELESGSLTYTATSQTLGIDDVVPFVFDNPSIAGNIYFNNI